MGADLLLDDGSDVVFIVAGDFNARPESTATVPALVYPKLKTSLLGLRSVYNDDILESGELTGGDFGLASEGVYSTWKARWDADAEEERVSKVTAEPCTLSSLISPSTVLTTSSTPRARCGALFG